MALTVALAASTVACGSDSKDETGATTSAPTATSSSTSSPAADPGTPSPSGTYEVGRVERTYVDEGRVTAAHGGQPEKPSRTLPTIVLYPAGKAGEGAEPLDGPWPLIVFSHGSTRAGVDYLATLEWWASAGYVVAAPNFPLSTTDVPGGTSYGDYENQTGDVAFVIDSVLADGGEVALSGLVDPEHIGLGGQSFGAITTLGTVAAACCADPRVKAATEFAGMWLPFSSGEELAPTASQVPILFVQGDEDPTIPYANGRAIWERIGAPGGFRTLVGSGHDGGFFLGGEEPLDKLVAEATLAFYDAHLKGDATGQQRLESVVADAGPEVAKFDPTPT